MASPAVPTIPLLQYTDCTLTNEETLSEGRFIVSGHESSLIVVDASTSRESLHTCQGRRDQGQVHAVDAYLMRYIVHTC